MAHPVHLSSLSAREAITDAVYRCVIAFDRNDFSLLESAVTGEDFVFELAQGGGSEPPTIITGLSSARDGIFALVGPMDTSHMISNVRVDIKDESAETASLTAYALSQHCPPGRGKEPDGPKYLVGGEYFIDLVKDKSDNGVWKVKKWVLDVLWRQGDPTVMGR